jgi:hypothetical protein
MSWSELERLVQTAESDPAMARALGHCRSGAELVLAARRLGFGVSGADLRDARSLAEGLAQVPDRPLAGPRLFPTHRQWTRQTAAPGALVAAATAACVPGAGKAATVAQSLAS